MKFGDLGKATVQIAAYKRMATTLGYQRGITETILQEGTIFLINRDLGRALHYFNQVIDLSTKHNFSSLLSSAYMNLGLVFYDQDTALALIQASLRIEKRLGNKKKQLKRHNNLAVIYLRQKDHLSALQNFFVALELSIELKDNQARLSK
jgi:tetratricopeptide (TPR) repeat protein